VKRLLIFGAGYTGQAIVDRMRGHYGRIVGTTRRQENFEKLRARGIEPLLFAGEDSEAVADEIAHADHIAVSIAPAERVDPVLAAYGEALLASQNLKWICYLSSVGVYGDHGGAWVDETSPCQPNLPRYKQRLEIEAAWCALASARSAPLAVLRLSGIYGPGRNVFVNIENGRSKRIVKPGQAFNRIHRDDVAKAFELTATRQADGVFNITDDLPAPPQDVVLLAHRLHGSVPPREIPFEAAEMTVMARSFYNQNKRVSNARSKAVLGLAYDWPDYKTALKRMWREGSWRG
jgi:nucleoside-diphosphate-sugar epimerase